MGRRRSRLLTRAQRDMRSRIGVVGQPKSSHSGYKRTHFIFYNIIFFYMKFVWRATAAEKLLLFFNLLLDAVFLSPDCPSL